MDVTIILNVLILLMIVLYGVHFTRQNKYDKDKSNQIDKALYIEVRRASRLSLQCNMLLNEMSEKQVGIGEEIDQLSEAIIRIEGHADQYLSHDIKLDNVDNIKDDKDAIRLIIIRQRQILKHLEELKEQVDTKSIKNEESK